MTAKAALFNHFRPIKPDNIQSKNHLKEKRQITKFSHSFSKCLWTLWWFVRFRTVPRLRPRLNWNLKHFFHHTAQSANRQEPLNSKIHNES